MRGLAFAVAVSAALGCQGPHQTGKTPVGKLVSTTAIPGLFGAPNMTIVTTTGGTFTVVGAFSAVNGEVYLITWSDGEEKLFVEGNRKCWFMYDR